jgi:PPOX class probable F420-dependent enzyme
VTDEETRLWELIWGAGRGALVTIKRDGRAQVSTTDYTADPSTRTLRVSTTADRAKIANLRRDPRASFYVTAGNGSSYAVGEGEALVGPTAQAPDDAAVEELIEVYRRISGEHPDWADYRRAMVEDRRLVLSITLSRVYGWVAPEGHPSTLG